MLTDIALPVMDGVKATREILRRHPGMPVVAMTVGAVPVVTTAEEPLCSPARTSRTATVTAARNAAGAP